MKKLLVLIIALTLLASILVSASWAEFEIESSYKSYDKQTANGATFGYESISGNSLLHLDKGWNLVYTPNDIFPEYVTEDSELTLDDISVIYLYFPLSKKYVKLYPYNKEELERQTGNIPKEEIAYAVKNGAMARWVYAKNSGMLKLKQATAYNAYSLYKGINLISLTPMLEGKSLDYFAGNCNIVNVYEYSNGKWKNFDVNKIITSSDSGRGIAIKVADDCVLFNPESGKPQQQTISKSEIEEKMQIAEDSSKSVNERVRALLSLAQSKDASLIPRIEAILDSTEKDPDVRYSAITAARQIFRDTDNDKYAGSIDIEVIPGVDSKEIIVKFTPAVNADKGTIKVMLSKGKVISGNPAYKGNFVMGSSVVVQFTISNENGSLKAEADTPVSKYRYAELSKTVSY